MAKSSLADAETRSELIRQVGLGGPSGTIEAAAKAVGSSKSALHRYCKAHPEFRAALDVAKRQAAVVAHHAPRALPAKASPDAPANFAPDGAGCASLTPTGRSAFLELLGEHARDPQSKGCSKAIDILAQLHLAPEVLALQAEAKRRALEADAADKPSQRPVVIRVPRAPRDSAVIVAEVIKPGETRH